MTREIRRASCFSNEWYGVLCTGNRDGVSLGVAYSTVPNLADGTVPLDAIVDAIRPDDPHYPASALVCLESSHNACGGRALSPDYIAAVGALCAEHNLPLHLDGARVFNAAVARGLELADYVAPIDTLSICLSKGLGCPVGSVVVGPTSFIDRARRARKAVGGGMRQAGVLAAAGLYAVRNQVDRLAVDHANAIRLATGIAGARGVTVDLDAVETNIIYFRLAAGNVSPGQFVTELGDRGVLLQGAYHATASSAGGSLFRGVTHQDVDADDIDAAVAAIHEVLA